MGQPFKPSRHSSSGALSRKISLGIGTRFARTVASADSTTRRVAVANVLTVAAAYGP